MITPHEVYLGDGRKITIRPITVKDAPQRHQFFVELSLAQTGIVHTVDEIDYHTSESLEHITDFLYNQRGVWLIALTADGSVVAEVDITIKNLTRVRHNGLLTIGVRPDYQHCGLGTLLLRQALAWAERNELKRIEVSLFNSNIKAQKLYNKCGFIIEGRRKNFFRHPDGTFEDDVMMAKYF